MNKSTIISIAVFVLVCYVILKVLPTLFLIVLGLGILGFGTIGWYKLKAKRPETTL